MADKKNHDTGRKSTFTGKTPPGRSRSKKSQKERDARTHRLVQEGAILESIVPHIKEMDLDSLKRELMIRLRGM